MKTFLLHLITLSIFCHAQASNCGPFVEASALYWQAEEEGLSYAVKSRSSDGLSDSEILSPKFEWDFGFKVGLGYRIPHDHWEFLLQWTSLQTHCDHHAHGGSGHVLFPSWVTPFLPIDGFIEQADAHWRLHLGLVDFLWKKPVPVTRTLTLTPLVGVRWGSLRQKYNIQYGGGVLLEDAEVVIRTKNKFAGLGPMVGVSSNFEMTKGFSLFADGAASLLYGEFYVHQSSKPRSQRTKTLKIFSIYRSAAPILEGAAGIRWQRSFSGGLKRLTLQLGWDQLLFFSQNQLIYFLSDAQVGMTASNLGDLSIAGVEFSIKLEF